MDNRQEEMQENGHPPEEGWRGKGCICFHEGGLQMSLIINGTTLKTFELSVKASRALDNSLYLWMYLEDLEIALLDPEKLSKRRIEYILEQIEITKNRLKVANEEKDKAYKELEKWMGSLNK